MSISIQDGTTILDLYIYKVKIDWFLHTTMHNFLKCCTTKWLNHFTSYILNIPTHANTYIIKCMLHNAFWSDFQLIIETDYNKINMYVMYLIHSCQKTKLYLKQHPNRHDKMASDWRWILCQFSPILTYWFNIIHTLTLYCESIGLELNQCFCGRWLKWSHIWWECELLPYIKYVTVLWGLLILHWKNWKHFTRFPFPQISNLQPGCDGGHVHRDGGRWRSAEGVGHEDKDCSVWDEGVRGLHQWHAGGGQQEDCHCCQVTLSTPSTRSIPFTHTCLKIWSSPCPYFKGPHICSPLMKLYPIVWCDTATLKYPVCFLFVLLFQRRRNSVCLQHQT